MTDGMNERHRASFLLLFLIPSPSGGVPRRLRAIFRRQLSLFLFPRRDHLRGNKAALARSDLHPSPRRGLSLKDEGVTAEYYSG